MSFFSDKSDIIGDDELGAIPEQGTSGKQCPLMTNCFKIAMSPNAAIHHHRYRIVPPAKSFEEERWVLQKLWGKLQKQLRVFVLRCPGHIFSTTCLTSELKLSTPVVRDLG